MPGLTPPNLPGFTFLEPIGQGGFADVYLYEQRLPTRRVAVKVLKRGADGVRLDMFHAEANVMAQLSSHPSIMPIYQADVSADGHPYLVMEFCPGPHLAHRFRREQLPVHEVLEIAVKVCSAVETAHRAGILHRDIKPHNILVNAYGAPLLTDFGIATAVGDTEQAEHGMSIPWSAPEVLADSPRADVRSDVFSLAATAYSLLAGRSPFEVTGAANDSATLVDRIERQQPMRLVRPDVPESLNDVLLKGMSKRPADRQQTAMSLARELQEIEIELQRTPTRLEVLDAGPRPAAAAGNDERTMIKPISVIVPEQFQPTAEVGPSTRPAARIGSRPSGVVSATEYRQFASSAVKSAGSPGPNLATPDPTHHGTHPDSHSEPSPPRREADRVNAWAVGLVLLLVSVIAVFGALSMFGASGHDPEVEPTRIVQPTVDPVARPAPAPALDQRETPDGVRFTWTNPDPVDGDTYKVVRTRDGALLPEQRTDRTSYDFKLNPGESGCLTVTVIRKNLTQRGEPSPKTCVQR